MKTLLAAVCAVVLAIPAFAALKPETEQFLTKNGIDPKSPDIVAISGDVVNKKSLDTLATGGSIDNVNSFIATRTFIRAFKKDSNADFPSDDLYNIGYLSAPEKLYIATQLSATFPPLKTKPA